MCCSFRRGLFRKSPFRRSSLHKDPAPSKSLELMYARSAPSPMPSALITVVGALNTDLVTVADRMPKAGETIQAKDFSEHYGGKAANTSIAAYRLSHEKPEISQTSSSRGYTDAQAEINVRMIGRVGDDHRGPKLINNLEANGIDASGVRQAEGCKTGVAVVIVDSENGYDGAGENRLFYHAGANQSLTFSEFQRGEPLAGASKPDLLISQLEIPPRAVEQILAAAHGNGIETLLNPSPADWLLDETYYTISHLVLNQVEASDLTGITNLDDKDSWVKAVDVLIGRGVKNVVLTLGANGAYFANVWERGHVEAVPNVTVKDTTGAGDTFTGAYAVDFVRQKQNGGWNIRHAVEFGCKAAARTIQAIGAQDSIPWLTDLDSTPARRGLF